MFKILNRLEKVRNFMLLYNIDKETMEEVLSKSKIMLYKANEIIFYQNSTPLNLYLVLSGEISFKKYSNMDLLTMIGSEANIIPSKRYSDMKYRNSKMSRQSLQTMRSSAFKNYQEDTNKKPLICGDFFCEQNLVSKASYENCAVVEKDSYVVCVSLNVFNLYLKKNVSKTLENIKELVLERFHYFKTVDNNMLKMYMGYFTKLFPKNGEIICKENEPSNKLYLIYQGKFAVQKNSKNLGNLIFLNKGDIFGYDSLINIKPIFETETKINIEINIKNNEYDIVNKDNTSIILCLDIPFLDELTTWKISKNLLSYFKEQNDIIHNFETIKKMSSLIFEEKYINLAKKKRNKSLNENNHHNNIKEKKYKLLFKKSVNSKKNYTNLKISNKRKVNFLTNYVKVFPKNYFKTNFQKYKLKDSHSSGKNQKTSYSSLLFKDLNTKNYSIKQKRNGDIEKYITPNKKIQIQENIQFETYNSNQKYTEKKSSSSSLFSSPNYAFNNSKSNSTKSTAGKRRPSNKISTFESMPSTTQYKSRSKMKSTLFHNFMSYNKNMSKNKTTKKKNKNKIYFRNGNNISTKFDITKNMDKRNPLYIFSYLNSTKFNLTVTKGKSVDKRPKEQIVSKYNFPFIYEGDEDDIMF